MTIATPEQQLAVEFRVNGLPAPQGSKSFKGYRGGRPIMVESSQKVGPWRTDVRLAAERAYTGDIISVPVHLNVDFFFARPKSHYRTGKYSDFLRADAPQWATSKVVHGDLDKLLRSTFDALSYMTGGSVLRDDSQVASVHATKRYADETNPPGALIQVALLAS